MTITLRSVKGSGLTNAEIDENFTSVDITAFADKASIVDADKLGGRDSVTGLARLFSLSVIKTALAATLQVPVSTGVTGLGAGVATFLATPTSANLATALTNESGTGVIAMTDSPALTGSPTAPTALTGDNSTSIATTAFVHAQATALIDAAEIDSPIRLNPRNITADFTVTSAYNAFSAGPMHISSDATVHVEPNATWTIS